MRKVVVVVLLGLVGLLAATSLTLGALAVAGDGIGSVLRPQLDDGRDGPSVAPSASDAERPGSDRKNGDPWTPSASHSAATTVSDDAPTGSGSSDDDGSGSSGSGSDDSGSDDSGSGDSDDHDDD